MIAVPPNGHGPRLPVVGAGLVPLGTLPAPAAGADARAFDAAGIDLVLGTAPVVLAPDTGTGGGSRLVRAYYASPQAVVLLAKIVHWKPLPGARHA